MRQVLQFLKSVFAASIVRVGNVSDEEMTLHDALRLCSAARPCHYGGTKASACSPSYKVDVCRYRSDSDLSNQWRRWDHSKPPLVRLTVVLVLGRFLRGGLRDLVRQHCIGQRLIIVPQAGHWPGTDSLGDLELRARSLGWGSIEMSRDLVEAIGISLTSMVANDRLLVMLPLGDRPRGLGEFELSNGT